MSTYHEYCYELADFPTAVAGTHYDLRLQCNPTSSISFAIMYGLPGDPNSRRLNRNATETRVHCLWNHLIETASYETGTMLIWDTGEYEVLPYYAEQRSSRTADSDCESESEPAQTTNTSFSTMSQPEKLAYSFARRKIRIRLHGTRLPPGYTLGIRLNHENDRATQPKAPSFKRKRKQVQLRPTPARKVRRISTSSSSSVASNATKDEGHRKFRRTISSLKRTASPPSRDARLFANYNVGTADSDHSSATYNNDSTIGLASEGEDENEAIRLTNAYPGATNSIGSIHQRKWYLSMDRSLSGFVPIPTPKDVNHHAKTYWIRGEKNDGRKTGFERFHVLGRDVERSVVTGRLAADILRDEGVEGYVPRGMWRGVTE